MLLINGADINKNNEDSTIFKGYTPLITCIEFGNEEILEILLNNPKIDVNKVKPF